MARKKKEEVENTSKFSIGDNVRFVLEDMGEFHITNIQKNDDESYWYGITNDENSFESILEDEIELV